MNRWVYWPILSAMCVAALVTAFQALANTGFTVIPTSGDLGRTSLVRLAAAHPFLVWSIVGALVVAGGWASVNRWISIRRDTGRPSIGRDAAIAWRPVTASGVAVADGHDPRPPTTAPQAGGPVTTGSIASRQVLRIFVSSTSVDLPKHRQAVRDALAGMGHFAVGMEHFGAHGVGDPATVSVEKVAECDAYVGIVAWRYGFVPRNETRSVTHLEYLEAKALNKPCFLFLADDSTEFADGPHDQFPADKRDPKHARQLRAFRTTLRADLLVADFIAPDQLATAVVTALHNGMPTAPELQLTPRIPTDYSGTDNGLPLPPQAARGGDGEGAELGLVGRDEELRWLENHILDRTSKGVWAIRGMGGIGKTALVAVCIAKLQDQFDGGVAVVRAENVTEHEEVLRQLVQRFVKSGDDLLARPGVTRKDLADALLNVLLQVQAEQRLALVVIDNVEPELAAQAGLKNLLDLLQSGGVSVVMTSREHLGWYVQESKELATLGEEESIELFARVCNRFPEGVLDEDDRREVAAICSSFEGHALATVVAASQLSSDAGLSLAAYRERLARPFAVLKISGFEAPKGVGAVFATSYDHLAPGAQLLFAALGVLAGRGATIDAAVALGAGLGQEPADAQTHVSRLIVASLVSKVTTAERIELHPLVQQFTSFLFGQLSGNQRDSVQAALANHYAEWTPRQNSQELSLDASSILAALAWAASHAPASDPALAGLAYGLRWFFDGQFDSAQAFAWLPLGCEAMRRIERSRRVTGLVTRSPDRRKLDARTEVGVWRRRHSAVAFALGVQHQLTGRIDEAERWFTRSHKIASLVRRRYGDPVPLAEAYSGLAAVAQQEGRSEVARQRYQESLSLFEAAGDRTGQADAHYRLGFLALRVGDCALAQRHLADSLGMLSDDAEDQRLRAVDYYSLGNVSHQKGDLADARRRYQEAYDTCVANDNRRGQGAILKAQGDLAWLTIGPGRAVEHLERSRTLFGQIFDQQAESVARYSIAFMHRQVGRIDDAAAYYELSLGTRIKVKDRRGEGFVRKAVGDVQRRTAGCSTAAGPAGATRAGVRSDIAGAQRHLKTGLRLSSEVGDRRNRAVALKALGDWAWQSGDLPSAAAYYEQSRLIRGEVQDKHGEVITAKALADIAIANNRLDGVAIALAECTRLFTELEDQRGHGAALHSRAVLAWLGGDLTGAAGLAAESLGLLTRVEDIQSRAVVTYSLARLAAEPPTADSSRADELYRSGLALATSCRAVHIFALLEEGHGNLLLREGGADDRVAGTALLRHAAELFHGMGRVADAKRAERSSARKAVHRQLDRPSCALVYDLDEGPNGQGFAIPNDRRRTADTSRV